MSKKIDKHELKGPDAFVTFSDRVFSWMEKHASILVTAVLGVVVISAGYVGYDYYKSSQEARAAESIYKAEAPLHKKESDMNDPAAKAAGKAEDFNKDYLPLIEPIKSEIKSNSSTKSALISALNLAYFLVQQKQFEQALEVLGIPTFQPSGSDMLAGFWNMHRGLVYLENKKFKEASEAYESVLKGEALKYFHPEALLKLGLAQELQGEKDKARATYEKLGREFPNSEASTTGQQYLRLMDLKS